MITNCFSCPGDVNNCLNRLSEAQVIRFEPNQDQAMADLTADLWQQLVDYEADKDK